LPTKADVAAQQDFIEKTLEPAMKQAQKEECISKTDTEYYSRINSLGSENIQRFDNVLTLAGAIFYYLKQYNPGSHSYTAP
jgi:hypothetical protein